MITEKQGNILKADVEALVNTVNTVGAMGKGIALQFKKAFPEMFPAYKSACKKGVLTVEHVHVFKRTTMTNPRYIINFATKKDWKYPSKIEYIEKGLASLIKEVEKRAIKSIALPPLGCGLGGLEWAQVYELIKAAFMNNDDVEVWVYPPQHAPTPKAMVNRTKRPEMNSMRAAVLEMFDQYLELGYELTLIEIHKILYFLQESGFSLRLQYRKHFYGPYADNVRHVLHRFEGHFTHGFGDGRHNAPETVIEVDNRAINEAKKYLKEHGDEHIEKCLTGVKELVEGFESPYGLELLASIHWLIHHDTIENEIEAICAAIASWNERKKKVMQRKHIEIAYERLKNKGYA